MDDIQSAYKIISILEKQLHNKDSEDPAELDRINLMLDTLKSNSLEYALKEYEKSKISKEDLIEELFQLARNLAEQKFKLLMTEFVKNRYETEEVINNKIEEINNSSFNDIIESLDFDDLEILSYRLEYKSLSRVLYNYCYDEYQKFLNERNKRGNNNDK